MLSVFSLYLVTDTITDSKLIDVILSAVQGGVTAVQLRDKDATTRKFVDMAKQLKKELSVPLIINDRVDIALAVGADGVHLGQSDLSYLDARKILGDHSIIGLSVESIEDAESAIKYDADYLGLSSIFRSQTKIEANGYWDKNNIKKLKRITTKHLVGIGGLNEGNISEVKSWGVDSIAVSSAICSAQNLKEVEKRAKELKRKIVGNDEN